MLEETIHRTICFVKETLQGAEAGHNWFHTERVWKISLKIAEKEPANLLVVSLAALLHDIADPKFHQGDEDLALRISKAFLKGINLDESTLVEVLFIIKNVSFKNKSQAPEPLPIELKIVQDADRLDALGAIGIARTFHFGGYKNNPIYDPQTPPNLTKTKGEYMKNDATTINHFYEKLLLLKDGMHTQVAQEMAEQRHQYMLGFLEQFYAEWKAHE